ncbi:hypothetical protein [Peristeroidobacter agariperforans]|uniref:hypothetical protein n=1 Tax=Peristeroidobacter agariperforans TaxID=268404 RepID=UPI00101D1F82|nr:hypothetical protein [Peristeroidobacter agariperforans]
MAQMFREEESKALSLTNCLYAVAVISMIVSCVPIFMSGVAALQIGNVALCISAASFATAFLTWVVPKLRALWKYPVRRYAIVALHATILLVAVPISRHFTAVAIGLPPQDFDIAVAFVALELYPALWVLTLSLGAMSLSVGLLLVSMIMSLLSSFPWIASGRANNTDQRSHRLGFRAWLHAMGATLVAIGAAMPWDWHADLLLSHPDLIRRVAYLTDYQPAARYPGVNARARLRLHENGVVSYAEPNGWNIDIVVGQIKQ